MPFDPAKNALNIAKHGIELSFGDRVMQDGNALHMLDNRMNYGKSGGTSSEWLTAPFIT